MNWTQNATGDWNVQVSAPDNTTGTTDLGAADVQFGSVSGNSVAKGTIGSVTASATDPGTVTTSSFASGQPATLTFDANFGTGNQAITLNLGDYGGTNGVTRYHRRPASTCKA